MKKTGKIVVCALAMSLMFAGCGKSEDATTAAASEQAASATTEAKTEAGSEAATSAATEAGKEEKVVGGWEKPADMKVTDEIKNLMTKATEGLDGATYEPLLVLGTQVVAGTNYRILCAETKVVPDAKPEYAIVTLYADLEGNAKIEDVADSGVEAVGLNKEQLAGGIEGTGPAMTEEAQKAFDGAVKTLVGAEYKAIALLGTQVVAGTNYFILCETETVTENPQKKYALMKVYAPLQGDPECSDIQDIGSF